MKMAVLNGKKKGKKMDRMILKTVEKFEIAIGAWRNLPKKTKLVIGFVAAAVVVYLIS